MLLGSASASEDALVLSVFLSYVISHYLVASVTAARMRDAGQSPHWAWLIAVPFAVTILFIVGLIAPSKKT